MNPDPHTVRTIAYFSELKKKCSELPGRGAGHYASSSGGGGRRQSTGSITSHHLYTVLRIRDVYPGSDFFQCRIRLFSIPNPGSELFPSRVPDRHQKIVFYSSRKYDPGCSSRIPDPDPDFFPIPDPGSQIQGSKMHRIPDPQQCSYRYVRVQTTSLLHKQSMQNPLPR
jgi:hypothetical protein